MPQKILFENKIVEMAIEWDKDDISFSTQMCGKTQDGEDF